MASVVLVLGLSTSAWAIPSFARQTGLPCSRCHTSFPELTAFGREFKLNGYMLSADDAKHVTGPSDTKQPGLWINQNLPLSVMFQLADTVLNKAVPGAQNRNLEFPQQFSLFLGGEIGSRAGTFMQFTYTGANNHFAMDNTDIRFVNQRYIRGAPLVYGLDLNNNPTVEDLWNDTPAWGFPFAAPDSAPRPAAAALIDGGLAQDVGGVGGYAMWNHHLYGDVTLYRSMHLGGSQPPTGTGFGVNIVGAAPYWRAAYQTIWGHGRNYLEVGTFGIHVNSFPGTVAGTEDHFTDNALDAQYERHLGNDVLTLHTTYIHERSHLDAALAAGGASASPHVLNTFRFDGLYHIHRYTLGAGSFSTTGTTDPLVYAAAPLTGSTSGNPKSAGYFLSAGAWLQQNIELSLNYRGFTTFNGSKTNYDGAGRNASHNNATYINLWLMF